MINTDKPSSTITAAFLAGLGVTLAWMLIDTFYLKPNGMIVDPLVVSTSTTFASALAGYLKKENVYIMTKQGDIK